MGNLAGWRPVVGHFPQAQKITRNLSVTPAPTYGYWGVILKFNDFVIALQRLTEHQDLKVTPESKRGGAKRPESLGGAVASPGGEGL